MAHGHAGTRKGSPKSAASAESARLVEARERQVPWKRWGPYLSERQWGTVREDYSPGGDAWNFFTHEQSRSRAYRWGEDGLAGFSDEKQRLCLALALWNGRDPILKERLFGLSNGEGNHGEDAKEVYYYLDSTPTHSYMKYLYKYPQGPFPYAALVEGNRRRGRGELEYELVDTGAFDGDRYFDVFVEYAKASAEDVLVRITAWNRGPEAAELHVLPTLWFRNTWAPWLTHPTARPGLARVDGPAGASTVEAVHPELGTFRLQCDGAPPLLFTENETNHARLGLDYPDEGPYLKDAFHDRVVQGRVDAVNPEQRGTKSAAHHRLSIAPGASATVRLRLTGGIAPATAPFADFDDVFASRLREADAFYASITPPSLSTDEASVMRQALAGMLWSKQYFYWDGDAWLREHDAHPLHHGSKHVRNRDWFHMVNDDVISMPDKWEYPWYAAWDLAFHAVPLSMVDPDFAKEQLEIMLRGSYLHPNGQIPAYEWNFGDVNPPVHAWATLFLHRTRVGLGEEPDLPFLKSAFLKLLLNFTWWVNRKDRLGKNVFEGGFLGLDNIGVFDRSAALPTGGHLEQADGTAWMALFTQNMLELAIEIAAHDPAFEDMAVKFVEHFVYIAAAMNQPGPDGMWDEEDGFYYDLLRLPDGSSTRLKVRSMVGLLPLCATTVVERWQREHVPAATERIRERILQIPELDRAIHPTGPGRFGVDERGIFALVGPDRLRRILARMLDEEEFLSPYGIRSLSRFHEKHPYVFHAGGREFRVGYVPAESDTGMFGGNSNWRGPVWMPVNVLVIRALLNYHLFHGDAFRVECPTGSGRTMNLLEVAREISARLCRIFLRDANGRRPVYGGAEKFQSDPHWRDHVLFYEYFHGDLGAGLGASHQTGWTGLVAKLLQLFATVDPEAALRAGKRGAFARARD